MKLSFEDWWETNYVNAQDEFGKLKYRAAYLLTAGPVAKLAWEAALAQQAQPDMIRQGQVLFDRSSKADPQPARPTRQQIAAIREYIPMRVGGDDMDLGAGWCAAIDAVLALYQESRTI